MAITTPSTRAPWRHRLLARLPFGDSLLRNSALVMATNLTNALAGYAFWIVAARSNDAAAVGRATATISAMNLAALLAGLGVATGVVDRLAVARSEEDRNRSITAAAAMLGGAGLLTGIAALVVIPRATPELAAVLAGIGAPLVVIGVLTQAWGHALDHVFVAERRAEGMLARNAIHGLGKLALVAVGGVLAWHGDRFLLLTWVAGLLGALLVTVVGLQPRLTHRWQPVTTGLRRESTLLARPSFMHYLANVGGGIPMLVLPVLVVARLGAEAGGYFYLTWMVGGIFYTASTAVAGNLFAEGSRRRDELDRLTVHCARIIGAMLAVAVPGTVLLGEPVLSIFGEEYAAVGYPLLVVIAVSAVPDAITNLAVARWRVRAWRGRVAILNVGMTMVVIPVAWVITPRLGITGVGWAWVVAQSVGAVAVFVTEFAERRR